MRAAMLALVFALGALGGGALAQPAGRVVGTVEVTEADGAPAAGAEVVTDGRV